jgi:hypothetical protein
MLRVWPPSSDDENPPSDLIEPQATSEASRVAPGTQGASLASWIRGSVFTDRLRGYSTRDVDRDLAAIADALEAGDSIDPATLTDRQYPKSLRGYDVEAIRAFLDELRKKLTAGFD